MRILKVKAWDFDSEKTDKSAKAVVELSRKEIGIICNAMFKTGVKDSSRAQFGLLHELITHGSFDWLALEQAQLLMKGEDAEKEADNG